MKYNPFNTLTGRLVLVTLFAVVLSYAIAFFLYANERGAALRRAAENIAVERIVYAAEMLREAPSDLSCRSPRQKNAAEMEIQ